MHPETSTLIFPRCGINLADVERIAALRLTKAATAEKLGVSETQLDRAIIRHRLEHLFEKPAGEVFRGVSAADILRTSRRAANMSEAAKMLGVSASHFVRRMNAIGATHYFQNRRPRKRKVSKRAIVSLARQGYTRRDTAYLLGISPAYLKDLIRFWGLADEFTVSKGRAAWVTQRGYC